MTDASEYVLLHIILSITPAEATLTAAYGSTLCDFFITALGI